MMYPFIRYKPSTFYSNFSIYKLIKNNNSRSGIICSYGGGGGGGTGSGSQSKESDEAQYSTHQSSSYHINSNRRNEFDESELIHSLKEDIEQEITKSGAEVMKSTILNSSEFYVEYSKEGIYGKIEVTSSFDGETLKLNAKLNELSRTERNPIIEKREDVYQPVGNFYVVAFAQDDAVARAFYEKGRRAAEESRIRLQQKYLEDKEKGKSFSKNMEHAVMYLWTPMPPQIRQRFQEMMGKNFVNFTEYDQYGRVYFLNELALKMYQDVGEDFETLKIITAEEVSKIPSGPSFRCYYIPKEK
jgi:hypothetical protein